MKILIIFTLFSLALVVNAITKEEAAGMFMKSEGECRTKHGATQDHFNKLVAHEEVLSDPVGKCYAACIFTDLGMLKDGKMIKENTMIPIKLMFENDPGKIALAEEAVDFCMPVSDPDVCESSYKLGLCLHDQAKQKGLDMTW